MGSSGESFKALSKEKRRRKKKKKSFKTRWAEKYKRKHAELMSLMELDKLALQVPTAKKLPEMPTGLECCPTIVEVITTLGGVDRNGMIVELMRFDDNVGQKFYEISCRNDVVDKPCRFIEKMLRPVSRCVQQYTYAYGAVKKRSTVRFEYIRVRSGCACEILPSDL